MQHTEGEGLRNLSGSGALATADGLREATEDLRKQDARVPSRAKQGATSHCGTHLINRGDSGRQRGIPLGDGGLQRCQHVRSGVAIRDREDVEGVDLFDAALQAIKT